MSEWKKWSKFQKIFFVCVVIFIAGSLVVATFNYIDFKYYTLNSNPVEYFYIDVYQKSGNRRTEFYMIAEYNNVQRDCYLSRQEFLDIYQDVYPVMYYSSLSDRIFGRSEMRLMGKVVIFCISYVPFLYYVLYYTDIKTKWKKFRQKRRKAIK